MNVIENRSKKPGFRIEHIFNYVLSTLQTKFTIDGLIETLRRTKLRFVQCMLPRHDAACNDVGSNLLGVRNEGTNDLMNLPLLRSQVSWLIFC